MLHNMLHNMLDGMLDGMLASFDQRFYINFSFAKRFPPFIHTYVPYVDKFSCGFNFVNVDFEAFRVD